MVDVRGGGGLLGPKIVGVGRSMGVGRGRVGTEDDRLTMVLMVFLGGDFVKVKTGGGVAGCMSGGDCVGRGVRIGTDDSARRASGGCRTSPSSIPPSFDELLLAPLRTSSCGPRGVAMLNVATVVGSCGVVVVDSKGTRGVAVDEGRGSGDGLMR